MSSVKTRTRPPAEIMDYLSSHPDIFVKNPGLMDRLVLPHVAGRNVVSLIEHQVIRLRRELADLHNNLSRMEHESAHYRKLVGNIHTLALKLLMTQTSRDLYNILQRDLKTYYSADCVLLLIFTGAGNMDNHAGLNFHHSCSQLRFMFSELFNRRRPLCGSLQEEHLQALFGGKCEAIKSTVILPFADDDWQELLVLGSLTENRYGHGPKLDLLGFINGIICRKIYSWLPG